MYCMKCGKQIDDDSKFCAFCGEETDYEEAVPSEEAHVAVAPAENHKVHPLMVLLVFVQLMMSVFVIASPFINIYELKILAFTSEFSLVGMFETAKKWADIISGFGVSFNFAELDDVSKIIVIVAIIEIIIFLAGYIAFFRSIIEIIKGNLNKLYWKRAGSAFSCFLIAQLLTLGAFIMANSSVSDFFKMEMHPFGCSTLYFIILATAFTGYIISIIVRAARSKK